MIYEVDLRAVAAQATVGAIGALVLRQFYPVLRDMPWYQVAGAGAAVAAVTYVVSEPVAGLLGAS